MGALVLPGVYVTVRDEGLISASGVSVGTVGIVGTAKGGNANEPAILSSFADAKATFGTPQSDIDAAQQVVDEAKQALDAAAPTEKATKQAEFDQAQAALQTLEDNRYKCDLLDALALVFANGGRSVCAVRSADINLADKYS